MSSNAISKKLRVGVVRGGPSGEYEVSLKTGQNLIDSIRGRKNYEVLDLYIDRSGNWHIDGLVRPVERIFPHVDIVVNGLHGTYGEDGRIQQLFESHNIPYTGSGPLGSALGMNKPLAKKFFKQHGLMTPEHLIIKKSDYSPSLFQKIKNNFPFLKIAKPASSGSSLGVSLFSTQMEFDEAVNNAFEHSDTVLLEEYIKGREATCGVIEGSGYDEIHALHPVEIVNLSEKKDFWTYESKYSDELHDLICPGNFTPEESYLIQQAAIKAHKALGLRHYSRSDLILNRKGIYVLEVNTLPGLTSSSLFPRSLSVAGLTVGDFVDHIIELALSSRH